MFQVLKNGVVIADLRTSPAEPTANFVWYPTREFEIGDLVEIIFEKRSGAPDVSVGLNLQGITTTLTA